MKTKTIQPEWDGRVPFCSGECVAYDGKRCKVMGSRTGHICEPAVEKFMKIKKKHKHTKPAK